MKDKFPSILDQFQEQYTFEVRSFHDMHLQEISKISQKYNGNNFDVIVHDFVKLDGEYIQNLADKSIELVIDTLKLRKSKALSRIEIKNFETIIKSSLNSQCQSFRNNLKAFAASKGMERYYKMDAYWIKEELENRIQPAIDRLNIEIKKYNSDPLDFYSQSKDKFKFEIVKYAATSGVSLIVGFILGRLF